MLPSRLNALPICGARPLSTFARLIGVSLRVAKDLAVNGPVPFRPDGRRLMVHDADLEAAIARGGR